MTITMHYFKEKTIAEVQSYVPYIVQKINDATRKMIDHGAQTVIVPGYLPIGCLPIYLTAFRSDDPMAYDELKCLKGLNNLAMLHNDNLQRALKQLRKEYPDVTIVYADYYTALQWVLSHAPLVMQIEPDALMIVNPHVAIVYIWETISLRGVPRNKQQ